jgi:nucleotidyltransferase/DNA polymerase involved in DNA repair
MSVLCGRIPDFALALAARHQPGLASKPVALIGRDHEICAVSPQARQVGVQIGMNPRQAHMRCPELSLLPADLAECQAVQDAFLAEVAQWELPVEAHGMGMAYVDLHTITTKRHDAQGLAADLGRRVRHTLGDDLQPSLGWDHSKFCARAAAYHTQAGRMKLVAKEDEASFLSPLSIRILPLPPPDLQRLHWLGIQTLGQFAALPSGAVWQQFGKTGQIAQRWAQGRDNRPVHNMLQAAWTPLEVDFETPTEQLALVVEGLMAKLQGQLDEWAAELQGCTRLRLELHFVNHERRALDLLWLEPVSQPARLRLHLTNQLAGLNWPTALDRLVVTQAVTAELPAMQMALFTDATEEEATPNEVAMSLLHRYGPIFLRGAVIDAAHPIDERRISLVAV